MNNMTIEEAAIKNLYVHPFLEKYGISKITDFEIAQMLKFDLPAGQVIMTKDNAVIHGWDEVSIMKKMGKKTLTVLVLDIDADMVIQITSMKNMRRRLSRIQQAELIVELRHYMTTNEKGIVWKEEVPGDEINKKMGFLTGYSYGMINQLERIYKYNSELLHDIDEGLLTFTEAAGMLPKTRSKAIPLGNVDAESLKMSTDIQREELHTPSIQITEDENEAEKQSGGTVVECQDCIVESENDAVTGILPVKVKTDGWNFAGEKKTEPCESIEELVVRFASGKEIKLFSDNGKVNGSVFGKAASTIEYGGGIRHTVDGTEFHVFKSLINSHLQVIIYNADNLAA